jgi:hypothetical protein
MSALEVKKETFMLQSFDKAVAYEVAQLLSGSFTYPHRSVRICFFVPFDHDASPRFNERNYPKTKIFFHDIRFACVLSRLPV